MFYFLSPYMVYVFYLHFPTRTNLFPVPGFPLLCPLLHTIMISSLDSPLLEHVAHCLTPIQVVIAVSLLLLLDDPVSL
jgi:hypothetical protein